MPLFPGYARRNLSTPSPIERWDEIEGANVSTGLAGLKAGLAVGAPVKVYAVRQGDGTLKAYAIAHFTGEMPSE